MERSIPNVFDIFPRSPGERRRAYNVRGGQESEKLPSSHLKEDQKNPGSDSAVSLDSSDEDERNISKYFDYLEDENELVVSSKGKNKPKLPVSEKNKPKLPVSSSKQQRTSTNNTSKHVDSRESRKCEHEKDKDIKHIERHLSMKKTIRKKMMRDLQHAFVENPGEFQQDPTVLSKEKKNNIDINNLTISKRRLSKSEHSFLDMLKENENKTEVNKNKRNLISKNNIFTPPSYKELSVNTTRTTIVTSKIKDADDDSGNDSPTREKSCKILEKTKAKNEKKNSFWKRLTGGKNKNK